LLLVAFVIAADNTDSFKNKKRTLVVTDSFDVKQTHSKFFQQLVKRGHTLEYKLSYDPQIALSTFGEYDYDNLIILASKRSSLGGDLGKSSGVADFVDKGFGNVMIVAAYSALSRPLREIAVENVVSFDDDSTSAIDHFRYDTVLDSLGKHTVLACNDKTQFNPKVIPNTDRYTKKPVLYSGLAMGLDRNRNKLLLPILTGSSTSYSFNPDDTSSNTEPVLRGHSTVLVGALQARNGARITFVGSPELLSDKYFASSVNAYNINGQVFTQPSGNEDFSDDLIAWAFQDRGILRHRDVEHHLKVPSAIDPPGYYKVGEIMVYSVVIEEWDGVARKWVPYIADDIELELIMLHPYIRTKLPHQSNGKYGLEVKVPDTYGVFKLHVDYRREGLSQLIFDDQVTIRPTRIEEFERFVPAAYPYYTIMFVTMSMFFVFSTVFLYTQDKTKKD